MVSNMLKNHEVQQQLMVECVEDVGSFKQSDCKADDGANGTFIILHTCCCGDVSELWCLTQLKMDIFTTLYPVQYMFVIQGFLLDNIFKQWSWRTLIARLVSMKRKFKHSKSAC